MVYFVLFLTASLTLLRDTICIPAKANKQETPTLFVPSSISSYPALVHLHPLGYNTELLENAASFPRYAYNHDSAEYTDPLQRQLLFQNTDKRLEAIFQSKDNEKARKPTEFREEDFDRSMNSILFQDEQKPEFHDLDRRYKRHVISPERQAPQPTLKTHFGGNEHQLGPVQPTTWKATSNQQYGPTRVRLERATNEFELLPQRDQRRIRSEDLNYEPNNIRTARPLETPDNNKEFPDMSFFIPIRTQPLTLSEPKSDPYSEQLVAFMRTAFDSKNRRMD